MIWTHSICEPCWKAKYPERIAHKLVAQTVGQTIDRCCFCGKVHNSGIYLREHPDKTNCKDWHRK